MEIKKLVLGEEKINNINFDEYLDDSRNTGIKWKEACSKANQFKEVRELELSWGSVEHRYFIATTGEGFCIYRNRRGE